MCKKSFNNQYQTYNIISVFAYLAGVKHSNFLNEHEPMRLDIYDKLSQNQNASIIRNLCILRTLIEQHYSSINEQMNYEAKNLDSVYPNEIGDCICELENDAINILTPNLRLDRYVIKINGFIAERINGCKELFPEWVNWEYIKKLFIMPNGNSELGVKDAGLSYQRNRFMYPYQVYLGYLPNTVPENILYNDKKFLSVIYAYFGSRFTELNKVVVMNETADNVLTNFLFQSEKSEIFVDCENASPEKTLNLLLYLKEQNIIDRISKIILYNDENSSPLWNALHSFTNVPVINRMTKRVKMNKSLVDIQFSAGLCREYYENAVNSFILLTSDSDYCGLMSELSEANFLVMTEFIKCSDDMINAMDNLGVAHCSLDHFQSDDRQLLSRVLAEKICKKFNDAIRSVNIFSEIENLCYDSYFDISEEEKQRLAANCFEYAKLCVNNDGRVSVELEPPEELKEAC